jgi:hypothetical protein
VSEKSIDDAVNYLYTHGQKFAEAKAHRYYLEEYRKSLKALLMKDAMEHGAKTLGAAEMDAYANDRYSQFITGLKVAVEAEEALRWGLVSAQARIDVWRSTEASNRAMDKAVM